MTKNQRNLIKRRQRGNMLVFATAITVFLVAVLAFFSLGYVRLLGSNSEQRNAIEAASLAAARDLSMIAVDTDEYGWVSVSDAAPTGSVTTANDAYNVPVRGINSIIGTIRLDLIIANELADANLKQIIKADLVKAKAAQAKLATELKKAIVPGYIAKDINNQNINVYKDAEDAYTANQIRMTGSSNYVKNSLKLSLGSIANGGGVTNTPLPRPISKASVPSGGSQNNFYRSYFNQTFDGEDFVFAGIGDAIKLIDVKNWTPSVASLPYQMQTVVKAEADQQMNNGQSGQTYTIHAIACAQPANVADPKPAPGALSFSFPDGIPPEITKPIDMFTDAQLNSGNNCNVQTSKNGDYPIGKPTTQIVDITWPYPSLAESTGNVFRLALFDWWKRAGTKLNIDSAVTMMTDPKYNFNTPVPDKIDWKTPAKLGDKTIYNLGPIPNGNIHIYRIDPASGQISYQDKSLAPVQYSVAGNQQLYSENIDAITKSKVGTQTVGPFEFPNTGYLVDTVYLKPVYDVYIRDQVHQPGKALGGDHAGEPMDYPLVSQATTGRDLGGAGFGAAKPPPIDQRAKGLPPAITNQSDFAETAGFPMNSSFYNNYSAGPGVKNMRPTYQKNGMAVDVRFRRQVDTGTFKDSLGFSIGYVGEKYPPGTPAMTGIPYVPPPPPTPPVPDPAAPADPAAPPATPTP